LYWRNMIGAKGFVAFGTGFPVFYKTCSAHILLPQLIIF
jgi:hypothetical protein